MTGFLRKGENMTEILKETFSLCPVCLKKIPASLVYKEDGVYMDKSCELHGYFSTIVWRSSKQLYNEWVNFAGARSDCNDTIHTTKKQGCPFDCGLCREHRQETCSAAIMVTRKCNLNCPVCFTRTETGEQSDPDIESIENMYKFYWETFDMSNRGAFPVELCGGEPTVRDDLLDIVSLGKKIGFDYIQINTNGVRIGQDINYLYALKNCGATTIYLSFDGFSDEIHQDNSGEKLTEIKIKAVKNCSQVGIGVVLVPCIVPNINQNQIGHIIEFAKAWTPTVKGVYFQPISYFGHYPHLPQNEHRVTIPEIIQAIEVQTDGQIKRQNFMPPGCEHPMCSFMGFFVIGNDGKLEGVTKYRPRLDNKRQSAKVRQFTKRFWKYNSFKYLTIGGMAFQDVWNVDLERLKSCSIQIISPDGKLVPLCAKYLTGTDGTKIYPGIS
jgi:uncharacterized radical SAM superfamily Fe-S cluster-containing enzyme